MRSGNLGGGLLTGADSTKAGDDEALELQRVKCDLTEPLFKRLLRKLFPDQRKQERILVPPLVGYLGSMRSTKAYEVGDISVSGFCLLTEERWTPGTEMPITLETTGVGDVESEYFTVQATVVRCGVDGVGFSILLSEEESKAAHGNPLRVKWASKREMAMFLKRIKGEEDLPAVKSPAAKGSSAAGSPFQVRHSALTQIGSD